MKIILILIGVLILAACAQKSVKQPEQAQVIDSKAIAKMTLKESFQAARDNDDVSISLLKFWNEEVYVVIKEVGTNEYDYYYLPSPNPERQCVTVSNSLKSLSSVNHPKQKMQGNQLINSIGEDAEIVIVYDDGGDYITREQLQWIKEKVEQVQNK